MSSLQSGYRSQTNSRNHKARSVTSSGKGFRNLNKSFVCSLLIWARWLGGCLSQQQFPHLLQNVRRSYVVLIQNQEGEVIRQNLFRVNDVVRVSSYLLHEPRHVFHTNKLWR